MRSSHRFSLRARMLVLLIGVTVIFLLVMGTVSTVVLRNQWAKQFNANLVTEANTRSPAGLSVKPNGYSAVEVNGRLLAIRRATVQPLTAGTSAAATQELAAAVHGCVVNSPGWRSLSSF